MSELPGILLPMRVPVNVREDHLKSLTRVNPISGVAELIWNALDAEADEVQVKLIRQELGGLAEVIVEDNGHGMTFESAQQEFGSLGGSWKLQTRRSKQGHRVLHGKDGKGRWRAFSIGPQVEWLSISEASDGSHQQIRIRGDLNTLDAFELSGPDRVKAPTGTVVRITVGSEPPRLLQSDDAEHELSATLALYLESYPAVQVTYADVPLDPTSAQKRRDEWDLEFEAAPEARLTIIEWARKFERRYIYLCDENGMTLDQADVRIHAPGFDFTAYLSWSGFRTYQNELGVIDLGHPVLQPILEQAREQLREYFRGRQAERAREIVEAWKRDHVYPFEGEPQSPVETARRSLFEVVAVAASPVVDSSPDPSRRLSLRLIREALERDPGSLQVVLQEVLELPADKLEELESLLRKTSLSAIIAATRTIVDRLDFLNGLEVLLFEEGKEQLLERRQLHRILEHETWIFGEEFALTGSDQRLEKALLRHIKKLGRDTLADDDATSNNNGGKGIIDLMFARSVEQARDRLEYLVVELKRPTVRIGQKEIIQVQNYAFDVMQDERFKRLNISWDFVAVSNNLTRDGERMANQRDRPAGLIWEDPDGKARIWVRPWGEVIEGCRHRLKFVQKSLGYEGEKTEALEYLRQVHDKLLPPVVAALPMEGRG